MLGREHVSISVATVIPFIVPLIFSGNVDYQLYYITLLIAVTVGSLTPDADCGGKPKLYYDFKLVYDIMVPLQKAVIFAFKNLSLKYELNLEHEVNSRHRGIMHAPIGIFISSLILTLIAAIIGFAIYQAINAAIILFIFLGLLFGQFLHLLEDSCTVAGINWKFPFGTKLVNGKIHTFPKIKGKKDIRPMVYQQTLWLITILLVLGFSFDIIDFSQWSLYPLIVVSVTAAWVFIILASRTDYGFWYQDAGKIRKARKSAKRSF
ncbi:metal-dependent hydrolase [Methanolobus psychrotolerans]|uniref:metal-dependent hydrolase n=1 Tax=Methanolobus psychrotolerans TaxID=1874706 RepID=UPI000B91A384|nr:metal-dependent hydrolase [Methanolobus psychrotolerans]